MGDTPGIDTASHMFATLIRPSPASAAHGRLEPEPDLTVIGPIRYEVVEPLRKVRFVLEPNDRQPIAFNWLFEAAVPPHMEERNHLRTHYRVASELVRYHQTGVCSGWVEVDGKRTEMTPETWVTTRDHSWGVRYDVGKPMTDVHVADPFRGGTYEFLWSPVLMQRGDGTRYALFLSYGIFAAPGFSQRTINGGIEHPDGRFEKFADIAPSVQYDPRNRRLRKGHLDCTLLDGTRRRIEIEAISETGFHLGAGLYFGFDGHHHGEWRGDLHVDGERIEDCSTPENARRLHQIRDTVIFVRDPVGGGEGVGNAQPIIIGAHPERGLTDDSSFM